MAFIVANRLKVFVDGVEVQHVYKFNIAEGWVECHVTSPSGYSNMDAAPDDVLSSRLYGFVEIEEMK